MARDRRHEDEDEEDAPRPKRRRRPVEDDDEEEQPRRRSRARDEDGDEDRPRRTAKKGGMSKGLLFGLIGGGAALIFVAILLIVFLGRDGTVSGPPKAVFEAFAKELKAGRHDRALSYLAADARDEFEREGREFGKRPADLLAKEAMATRWYHEPFTVTSEEFSPDGRGVELTVTFAPPPGRPKLDDFQGVRSDMTIRMRKEGGKWKIEF